MQPLLVSIPHSGEAIPQEADWLAGKPEEILFRDVDRFVDELYRSSLDKYDIVNIIAEWHRYAVDLSRLPEDIDASTVAGNMNPVGSFPLGLHWKHTTFDEELMPQPISQSLHEVLVSKYYQPFHDRLQFEFDKMKQQGATDVYHIDAHSMPSVGTKNHQDPDEQRAEIVVSDVKGQSSKKQFAELVMQSYTSAGFQVAYNWPYQGGRITEKFGMPDKGQHTVQVEMNRAIYMDESTKKIDYKKSVEVKQKIDIALGLIVDDLEKL